MKEEEPSKREENPAEKYTVGYGKPPRKSQFQPGQSGNPKGRPKGSKNKFKGMDKKFTDLIKKEAQRGVTINDQGEQFNMSAAQTLLRVLMSKAMKGDSSSLKLATTLIQVAEEKEYEELLNEAKAALKYISHHESGIAKLKEWDQSFDIPLPHPGHVQVNHQTLEVTISGPETIEELAPWLTNIAILARFEVEAILHDFDLDSWIASAMGTDEEDTHAPLCQHLKDTDDPFDCDQLSCMAAADKHEIEAQNRYFYRKFRERIPFTDPLWRDFGPIYTRRYMDYYFFYGPKVELPKERNILKHSYVPSIKEMAAQERDYINAIDPETAGFRDFMRRKVYSELRHHWNRRFEPEFLIERDLHLDKMRFEYERGIFDPESYEIAEAEMPLFKDPSYLAAFMSWEPDEIRAEMIEDFFKSL